MAGKMRDILAIAAVLVLAASTSGNVHEPKAAAFAVTHLRIPSNIQADAVPPKIPAAAIAPPTSVKSQVKPVATSIDDIIHQTKLGAQFLKTAAQLTKMLSADEKAKMKDDAMMETTHDIVGYAKALMASMGQNTSAKSPVSSAPPALDFWTLRGPRPKPRPTCTVTSGYWDRECECEFLPKKNKKPHWPRPDEDDDDCDDNDDDHDHDHGMRPAHQAPPPPPPSPNPRPPPRPTHPWHQEHYYPRPEYTRPPEYYPHEHYYPEYSRPEYAGPHEHYEEPRPKPPHHHNHHNERPVDMDEVSDRIEHLVENLIGLLEKLSDHIEDVHYHPGSHHHGLRTEQRVQLIKAPLASVDQLKSIMKDQKLVQGVKDSGGLAMERFLKEKVADVEAMITYPDYLDSQLGKLGASQPLVVQMQSIIEKLEPLTN